MTIDLQMKEAVPVVEELVEFVTRVGETFQGIGNHFSIEGKYNIIKLNVASAVCTQQCIGLI